MTEMNTNRILVVAIGLALLAGCHEDDTMEDIWPDPIERTGVVLRGVQEAVSSYWAEHGAIPESLEALATDRDEYLVSEPDGWGNELRFVQRAGGYCIWSPGLDAQFGSTDDLAIVGRPRDGRLEASAISGSDVTSRCQTR